MIFDTYIAQLQPGMRALGLTAQSYADRIIVLLGEIHDALINDEFIETRRRYNVVIPAGATAEVAQVPTTDVWELEVVTPNNVAGIPLVAESGNPRYRGADGSTMAGLGIVFNGGGDITVSSSAVADQVVYLQFKVRTRNEARRSNAAGMMLGTDEMNPVNGDEYGGTDAVGRHGRMWDQGPNIRGAARGDGLEG